MTTTTTTTTKMTTTTTTTTTTTMNLAQFSQKTKDMKSQTTLTIVSAALQKQKLISIVYLFWYVFVKLTKLATK